LVHVAAIFPGAAMPQVLGDALGKAGVSDTNPKQGKGSGVTIAKDRSQSGEQA
jgi:hypothetical protein